VTTDDVQVWAVRSNGACVLRIAGELDLATADALADRAAEAVREVPGPVLLDLSGLEFLDARGARALDALLKSPPDGRMAAVRHCPLRVRRMLNSLRTPLDYLPAESGPARETGTTELADQVRRARISARESRLDASGTLARLTDTRIRLASTVERTDLVRQQVQRTLASSRATRQRLTVSGQENRTPAALLPG
jgi:anti-anti-sigma factor